MNKERKEKKTKRRERERERTMNTFIQNKTKKGENKRNIRKSRNMMYNFMMRIMLIFLSTPINRECI